MRDDQQEEQIQAQNDKQEMFAAVQDENAWLTKNAMDNMAKGITAPTNPMKRTITSYPGQKNRGTLERPLRDEDVGLKSIEDS
jgi:NADH:ubiquinone oxidoreductase subunit E